MIFSSRQDSLVTDEKVHIPAGYLHVWQGNYLFNTEHPPLLNDIAGLFAKLARPNVPEIPANFTGVDQWEYGDLFFYQSQNNVEKITFFSRFPFILLTLGLIYLVYLWAKTLFGKNAGLLAAALTAFSPNILAHGRLATTDIGLTFFFILALWLLRKYVLKPSWLNAALLGWGLGLVLLAKFSGLLILPVILIVLIFLWFGKKQNFYQSLGQFIIIISVALFLIWLVYLFSMRAYFQNLPSIFELEQLFFHKRTVSHFWPKLLLVPFNKFIQGVGIISDHNDVGHWAYLNGQVGYRGWWYYFPYVLWYKMTLAELVLSAVTVFVWFKRRVGLFDEFLLIFPALLFLAISMMSSIDIGIRHVLVILPFLYIFTSRLVKVPNFFFQKILIMLVIFEVIIALTAFPNYLAYFNQIAGGSKNGLKHLSDSNLDWHQNMIRFAKYARQNNIQKVYELCWDNYSFKYYGIEADILPNVPPQDQRAVVICAQQKVITPEGFNLEWVTNPPTGGPPDDIVADAMYIWRFDKKNIQ